MLVSKYKSLLNSNIWGNDVLPELNILSQIPDGNIRETDYRNIQKDNILEHSYFMTNGCNWFEPSSICVQLKFYRNQIKLLSLLVKIKSDKLKHLININFLCGSLPDKFRTDFTDICNAATKIYKAFFKNNTTWLQTNINSNIILRNLQLISPHVGDWYDHIIKSKLCDNKEF